MPLIQCEKGHFYDNGKFQECPICQKNKVGQPIICPKCQHQLPEKKKFCPYCGYRFEESNVQPVAPVQPEPQNVPQQTVSPVQQEPQSMPQQPVPPVQQEPQSMPQQPVPPVQAEPQQPVPPVQPEVQNTYQQPVQVQIPQAAPEKKSKKGLVIGICIAVVLIAGIVVGALVLYPRLQENGVLQSLGKDAEQSTEDETEGSSEALEDSTEDSVMAALQEKMDSGDYQGVIEDILAMTEKDASYEEAQTLLPDAVDGQLTASMEEVDSLATAGNYTDAFDELELAVAFWDELAEDDRTADLVSDKTRLDEKQESLLDSFQEYVYQGAMTCANNRDEEGVEDLFAEGDVRLDNEEYEASKIAVYAKLVVTEANGMNAEGEQPGDVLDYINDNLDRVENDCWVLELWDYFNALEEYRTGNVTTSTKVRHVTDGYILPDSDAEYLTEADINSLSRTELRLARYEIYARHGRIFSDVEVSNYFGQYDWYQGNTQPEEFQEATLNEYEKANRDMLVKYEANMGYR